MGFLGNFLQVGVGACFVVFCAILFKRPAGVVQTAEKKRGMVLWGVLLQTLSYPAAWIFRRPTIGFYGPGSPTADLITAAAALAAGIAAICLGWRAKIALGRCWALAARTIEGHELVTCGPFGRVRHPIYLAMGLLLLAAFLGFTSPAWAAVSAALFAVGTFFRAYPEDLLLAEKFGARFDDYRKRVPAFLPRPWRKAYVRPPEGYAETGGRGYNNGE